MKNKRSSLLTGILAIAILQFAVIRSQTQIIATNGNTVIINNFDTSDQVYLNDNLGTPYPWGNWFGAAFSNVVWSASDASAPGDNPGSGSMLIQSYFPDGGVSGQDGTQFVVYNGFGAFTPGFIGNGTLYTNVPAVTNFSCDVRFDPISATNADGTFPTIEFGTRGNDDSYGQHDFGSISIQGTNTNWVHVSIPVAPNSIWTNIGTIYVKIYSSLTGPGTAPTNNVPEFLYVDNLEFQLGAPTPVTNAPPPTGGVVIGSWQGTGSALAPAPAEGWIDWGNGLSITNTANTNKYQFVTGAVTNYAQSLQIAQAGYGQDLAIKLEYLPGGIAAFLTNHLLSFTYSVPPAGSATAGYSQLYQLFINASGNGFKQVPFSLFSATGDTGGNSSGEPNFNFYTGAPARSQVVTVDYSSILPLITARPSGGYIEIIYAFNPGGGAPTNWFVNNVVLSGGPVSTNITISRASYLPSGPSFVLTWNATAGASYSVVKTNTLVGTATNYWPVIVTGYPGTNGATGGPLSYTDTTATVSPSFYRVSSP